MKIETKFNIGDYLYNVETIRSYKEIEHSLRRLSLVNIHQIKYAWNRTYGKYLAYYDCADDHHDVVEDDIDTGKPDFADNYSYGMYEVRTFSTEEKALDFIKKQEEIK